MSEAMLNTSERLRKTSGDLDYWEVENEKFWETEGKQIANRNLWISIPSLLCGFAVWLYWSIITVQMLNLGFPFSQSELFTLSAIAGLSGATLRIPSSFLIRIAGGRNTIFFTTALLMIPAVGTGFALQNPATPIWVYYLLALLSGIGGGNFASSMSNISFFFPKRVQGTSLGLNAGLGNFGVTTMQILIPLVMTMGIFGGEPNDPGQHQRHPDRQDPGRDRNLHPQCRLRLAASAGSPGLRRLVRHEQHHHRDGLPGHRLHGPFLREDHRPAADRLCAPPRPVSTCCCRSRSGSAC